MEKLNEGQEAYVRGPDIKQYGEDEPIEDSHKQFDARRS
jgi:hypothetical protein